MMVVLVVEQGLTIAKIYRTNYNPKSRIHL